ncbi:MAG: site-specific DNA-methyltransferase [Oscillibacter sp.]|nr:site-specific DNA-methyltransferase [Oscillibacter sp.]
MNHNPRWEIIQGDAVKILTQTAPGTFDAVITDPPYASGGRTQAEKTKSPTKKYSSMGDTAPPTFEGEAMDQRSWINWCADWLRAARLASKPGAPLCVFIDWRQIPSLTDAVQRAGWIWRGIAVWDKGNSRPQRGRFRQQTEFIVWGSNGDMPISRPVPCLPGVFRQGNPQNRIHLTQKPLEVMRGIVRITEPGGRIMDPFAGSGTTILAAVLEGYTATGVELSQEYARLAEERVRSELAKEPHSDGGETVNQPQAA